MTDNYNYDDTDSHGDTNDVSDGDEFENKKQEERNRNTRISLVASNTITDPTDAA